MTEHSQPTLTRADEQLRLAIAAGETPDLLIVGGGITGAAIFAKAAAAGLRPWLLEKGDFASGTSSRSSKMLHGGLRYIASGDLKTVKQSADQKNWFAKALPLHVQPLPFLFLHRQGEFPSARIMDVVLMVYDRISGGKKHRRIAQQELSKFMPGFDADKFAAANLYYDAVTDDVALVYSLLLTGIKHGGLCANYMSVTDIVKSGAAAEGVDITDQLDQSRSRISCDMIVNASGVWANKLHALPKGGMRPLRGSHIVFPGWKFPLTACITVSHPQDKRPVYIYPWRGMTVVGCTDLVETADLEKPVYIHREERDYLLDFVNCLGPKTPIDKSDIVSTWSGLRPIVSLKDGDANPSSEPRHHQIWEQSGVVSIAGGKLATAMPMADDVLNAVSKQLRCELTIPDNLSLFSWHQAMSIGDLESILVDGAIKNLEDLFIRRSRLGLTLGEKLKRYKDHIRQLCLVHLGWESEQFDHQWQDFWQNWQAQYSPEPFGEDRG